MEAIGEIEDPALIRIAAEAHAAQVFQVLRIGRDHVGADEMIGKALEGSRLGLLGDRQPLHRLQEASALEEAAEEGLFHWSTDDDLCRFIA